MSMTFWIRRKKRNAMLRAQAQQQAAISQGTESVKTESVESLTEEVKEESTKPTRKKVNKNDNGADGTS